MQVTKPGRLSLEDIGSAFMELEARGRDAQVRQYLGSSDDKALPPSHMSQLAAQEWISEANILWQATGLVQELDFHDTTIVIADPPLVVLPGVSLCNAKAHVIFPPGADCAAIVVEPASELHDTLVTS